MSKHDQPELVHTPVISIVASGFTQEEPGFLNQGYISYARTVEMLNTGEFELVQCSPCGGEIPPLSAKGQQLYIQYEKERPNEREDVRLLTVAQELGDKSCAGHDWGMEFRLVKKGIENYVRHRGQDCEDPTLEWHAYVVDEVAKVLDKDGIITKDQFEEIKKRDINMLFVSLPSSSRWLGPLFTGF